MNNQEEIILELENLTKYYGDERAVFQGNLQLKKGKTLGLVGESGSGKSTIARCIMGITNTNGGRILFKGMDISKFNKKEFRAIRKDMQMIFQDPYSSFDPKKNFEFSLKEPILSHGIANKESVNIRIDEILKKIGIDVTLKNRYPRELSGGQCQRMSIARALLLMPELLICDEPVSALDISIQAQILNLLKEIQKEYNLTYLFISHDLNVTRYMSDDIAVIHNGVIVEKGSCEEVLSNPRHSYTKLLLDNLPPTSPR